MFRFLRPRPANPIAVVQGVLDTLDAEARKRCDTRALARIQEARSIITHECMRAGQ